MLLETKIAGAASSRRRARSRWRAHFHRQQPMPSRRRRPPYIQRLGIHRGRRHRNRDDSSLGRDGAGHSHVAAAHPRRGIDANWAKVTTQYAPPNPKIYGNYHRLSQRRHVDAGSLTASFLDAFARARRRDAY